MILGFFAAVIYSFWIGKPSRDNQQILPEHKPAIWVYGGFLILFYGFMALFIAA
jgi:hypothetical protein